MSSAIRTSYPSRIIHAGAGKSNNGSTLPCLREDMARDPAGWTQRVQAGHEAVPTRADPAKVLVPWTGTGSIPARLPGMPRTDEEGREAS